MIKVGNVWYPQSQTKLAKQMLIWRHRAWLTELRKRRKHGKGGMNWIRF